MHKLQHDATIKSSRCHDNNNYVLSGARSRDKKGTLTSADLDFISLSLVRYYAAIVCMYVHKRRPPYTSRAFRSLGKHAEHCDDNCKLRWTKPGSISVLSCMCMLLHKSVHSFALKLTQSIRYPCGTVSVIYLFNMTTVCTTLPWVENQ